MGKRYSSPAGWVSSEAIWPEITVYGPDRIHVTAATSQPEYLFLSEMIYPGWKAFINGQPASL